MGIKCSSSNKAREKSAENIITVNKEKTKDEKNEEQEEKKMMKKMKKLIILRRNLLNQIYQQIHLKMEFINQNLQVN